MFDSLARGFRMIWSSIKMGLEDTRLLIPSIITVFTNLLFGALILFGSVHAMQGQATGIGAGIGIGKGTGLALPGKHTAHHAKALSNSYGDRANSYGDQASKLIALAGYQPMNGYQSNGAGLPEIGSRIENTIMSPSTWTIVGILALWWLINRFLEGVTIALAYSHLTDGPGKGKFSLACKAVLESMIPIIILGIVTLFVRKFAGVLRHKSGGMFGFGFGFLAGMFEVFWTLAGHLILPVIVIEGTSFWGALKRVDRMAQGNLLAIGVGEVGIHGICDLLSGMVWMVGMGGFGWGLWLYTQHQIALIAPFIVTSVLAWICLVVVTRAFCIYIRAAFYTCLYVWAINAEGAIAGQRSQIAPPAPLAAALA